MDSISAWDYGALEYGFKLYVVSLEDEGSGMPYVESLNLGPTVARRDDRGSKYLSESSD